MVKGYGLGAWLIRMYPPLAKLFFLFLAHVYSYHNIPLDAAVRNSMTDPRMQQAVLVPFMIFILFVSIMIIFLVSGIFREEKHAIAIGASMIGTYSILGNRPVLHRIFFITAIAAGLAGTVTIGIVSSKQWISAFYAGVLSMVCGVQFTYAYSYAFFLPAFIFFKRRKENNG